MMEKYRKFERKCLRACTRVYRSEKSNYKHYESCKNLYNTAGISRIDCHIIKLVRDYFANISKINNNGLIRGAVYPNDEYYKKALLSGNIPPEAFTYLDKTNRITDRNNIPTIYHIKRRSSDKRIIYDPDMDCLKLGH